jgi:DNA-binding winged helix-turn-helix (wHTH) protein/tetratricopeptide (TPR) repeat protein
VKTTSDVSGNILSFPPFRLDPASGCLWRGKRRITLTPTDCAVLQHLVRHAGRLVTTKELLDAVWLGTAVTPGVIKVRVRRLRRALRDPADCPRFIETVQRRGYRFVAPVSGRSPLRPSLLGATGARSPRAASNFVGREKELADLEALFDEARGGHRQIVFVSGEPGIGKSTLVNEFLTRAVDPRKVWIGHGQCIETHGAAEPYMPVLEALGRACRGPSGRRLQRRLGVLAPAWVAQMPALRATRRRRAAPKEIGVPPERMVRELGEALDLITAERPLVLCVEDVHWSDGPTLTLLSALARRQDTARLFVVATYRPGDALASNQPLTDLVRELDVQRRCRSVYLGGLSASDVTAYLVERFPGHVFPASLAGVLHRRSEGNPLFLVAIVEDLVADGRIADVDGRATLRTAVDALDSTVPGTIRQLVARQRERLSAPEQEVLAAASVVGATFHVPLVAAALERPVADVEDTCARLAERQLFVRTAADIAWPDGTPAATCAFVHAVYQALWQERVGVSARRAWHLRIAERLERAHAEQSGELAAELATHFEAAGSYANAIRYLRRASANAMQRGAPHEAIQLARKGLTLLELVTDPRERAETELELRVALARLQITTGYAPQEAVENYGRLRELCRQGGDAPRLFPALVALVRFYATRAEFETARALSDQVFQVAQAFPERFLASAHAQFGVVQFYRGELLAAHEHLDRALTLHDPRRAEMLARRYLESIEVPSLGYGAVVRWHLGYAEQAAQSSRAVTTRARALRVPAPLAFALALAAWVHRLRREPEATRALASELLAVATEQGFPFWIAQATFELGWALAAEGRLDEGRAMMQDGLARDEATGTRMRHVGNVIAQIELSSARRERGPAALATVSGLLDTVERSGQRYHEPALYRLRGELLLDVTRDAEAAETCFQRALEVARRQRAKMAELRAAMSLARLWQGQGRARDARAMLAELYGWFGEGLDTADLEEARRLLAQLSGAPPRSAATARR